ncbi:hypothetical protein [Sulfuracidifex tepidarius]|nr:hypothetical protein [Sulfuracidifex tepidarius]
MISKYGNYNSHVGKENERGLKKVNGGERTKAEIGSAFTEGGEGLAPSLS